MGYGANSVHVTLVEKVLINWALPSDFIYHLIKSKLVPDEYSHQKPLERLAAIWNGKIRNYEKLLRIKEENNGVLPEEIKAFCKKTSCGYTRLLLTYLR